MCVCGTDIVSEIGGLVSKSIGKSVSPAHSLLGSFSNEISPQ